MSDLQANIYVTVSIDRVKVTLDKLHKFYYVLEYKDQKFNSSENPVKTQEIQWTDLRFTFKLDENEAKTASFKFQLWGPATKLKRSDFIIAEANVSFKDFLAKHAPNFEPVEREPQYNFESVFIRKGKEHGSLLFSAEVTGWKVIDDMLKSEEDHTRECAFQNFKLLSTTKNPKLNQYIRAETFQTINDAIKRSIKSSKKVKSPRKDTEKLIAEEKPASGKDENKNDTRKAFLELWEMLCKIDVNMRNKLISLGALQAIKKFIKCSDIEVQLHFLEMLKQFFTLAAHQKEIIKEGLLKKLISLVTVDELRVQMKAFEILLYFDEVHQPEMIRLGLVGKLISLLKHSNPSVQAKALEIIQYFDAKHQDLLISTGALKELTDLIKLDPKDAFTHGLILKTLSVISHFDVPHQREILEQQMHIPLLELLKLDSEKIKLKTLSVIEGFDPSYEQNFMDAGLLQFINILLDDERISIKTKAFETVTKLKHHTTEIIEVGILDRLLNLMNDSNTVLQMNAFEFVQKFPATQQQLIDAGVLKNVKLVLQSPLSASSVIISAALEFLITFEATYYKQIIAAGIVESVLAIMSQKITWTVVPYNKILNFCLKVLELYKADYEDEIVSKNAFNVFLDMLKPTGQRLDETIVFDFMTSFKKWRQHLKPVLSAFFPLLIDSRDKVRKGVISVIEKYPAEEHGDLMKAGLFDVLLSSFLVANQNQIVAQSFFTLMTSLKNYQEELFKSRARYDKLITIAKLNEFKRTNILDLFSKLEDSIKPKVLKYNLIGHLLEFAAVAPSSSKYSGAKLLDMITEFDGWKEALLELKALKNLTDFLNNPAKALQIKAMDLLEEFSTEKQVAMMQDGLVQALLQTVVINEDEGVQSRALDYLFNISNNPTFMEILCTSKDGSIIDGFAVRMDKSTAHPSIIIEDGGTKLTIDATKQNYANWCTCYGIEPMTKGVKCWEMVIDSPNMNNFMVGVCTKNQRNTEYLGQNVNGWSMYYSSGSIYFYHGGNSQLHKTERLNKGDTIGLIYDAENGQLEMYVKDEYVGIVYGAITGDVYPAVSLYNNTDAVTFRAAPQLAVKRESVAKEEQSAMNPIEAEVVNQWIGTSAQWFLAYRASVHGWHTRNFHSRCDFKGPTITIVRTPDAVFGGYSSMPWASTGGYKRDNNAFLFSLTNPHNLPPSKHQLYRNQQNSVYHDVSTYKMNFQANIAQASSGPTFGGGFDMYINLSNKEASYSNLGFSYQNANPNPPGLNAAHYFTGRNSQWNITDVEVYLQHKPKRMQRKLLLYQFVRTIEIVKPHTAKKFKEILFSIAGKKPVYKKYLLAVVQKILSEPGLLKPMQVTMEELKAGFGASGIELLSYRVVSVNGKKEPPAKDLSKQDGKYLESETSALEIVLEVLPRKSNNTDETNDSNNNNTNTNVMPADEELPYITHLLVSAPIKQALDKFSAAKDIVCFLSNDELEPTQLAKFNEIKFDDPSFEYKELLELKAEKTTDKATTNDCLLDFDEKQEDTVGANNNNVVEDKNDEELKALKKFLREVKLGVHKPTPPPQEVQTNQYGYVFVNEANERVRYKDEAMVDLSQFANGVITYRVEYLENGNIEWLADSTAVEDVIEVPPRPKKEVKDEAKEREEKERIEKLERELEEKEREEKERKERELKERGEHLNKTPEEREKDRIAAILADLRHDTEDDAETQTLQKIEEPYKPVAVIDLDSLAEKPLKQATMARYVTVKVLRPTKANTCTTLSHIALVGFFKSANKQPLPPPTTMMDISRRFGFVKEGIKMFNYASNGDTNGVLYWIGTQDGKSSTWGNPAESKRVTVTTSHPMFNTWMKPELILDRGSIINYWGSDLPIHFTLDMQNYEVYITHFTIRHAHNQAYGFIQNFGLAGSKDGDTWVQLFSQESSPFEKPHDWATLTVPEGQDFYRYFRLTQRTSYKDSPNFTGGPFMFISGFELYGTMRYFN